jgi:hypothetical protein
VALNADAYPRGVVPGVVDDGRISRLRQSDNGLKDMTMFSSYI